MGMAAIQKVRASVQADATPGGLKELDLLNPGGAIVCCLLYPRRALEVDGGMAVRLLKVFGPKLPELHGVFGTFRDHGEWRMHLLFPVRLAAEASLKVWDWRVLEVLDESVVRLEARVNG